MANPSKAAAIAAIKLHLQTHGSEDWHIVLTQFPEVPSASMWRWIREAKADKPSKAELSTAKARTRARMRKIAVDREDEAFDAGVEHIAKHVPAAPNPAYVSRAGAKALQGIDYLAEVSALYADAMMLREFAMKTGVGADGQVIEVIKNPNIFERQIAGRLRIIEGAVSTMRELWDLQRMQSFYETIIDEVAKESPDCQRRIMDRLREVNEQQGMTIYSGRG